MKASQDVIRDQAKSFCPLLTDLDHSGGPRSCSSGWNFVISAMIESGFMEITHMALFTSSLLEATMRTTKSDSGRSAEGSEHISLLCRTRECGKRAHTLRNYSASW